MKVVINRCYGGFSLSPKAVQEYYKRKGKEVFFYNQTKYSFKDKGEEYSQVDVENADPYGYAFFKDFGKKLNSLENLGNENWASCRPSDRDDPDLVFVVENLGESANGSCAELEIVEIPDGVNYEIDEYDGMESIHESHRSWY